MLTSGRFELMRGSGRAALQVCSRVGAFFLDNKMRLLCLLALVTGKRMMAVLCNLRSLTLLRVVSHARGPSLKVRGGFKTSAKEEALLDYMGG